MPLKAKPRDDVAALVLDHRGAFQARERFLGVFVAERRGLLVIALGGFGALRAAAAACSGERPRAMLSEVSVSR